MKPRFVKLLIGLYPRGWRARYGEEFRTLLEEQPTTLGGLTNIIRCALSERLRLAGGHLMKDVKSSLMLFLFAGVATLAAGANLYFIVDDTPLAAAMQAHSALAACWLAMAAGSVLAIAGVAVASVPVLWAMARFAWIGRRLDIGRRLAFAPGALFAVLLWIAGVVARTHWVPLPWAVTGDWLAPANWPPLNVRWELCWMTLALLAGAVVGSAMSLRQALTLIESSPPTPALAGLQWPSRRRLRTFALAIGMATLCTLAGATVGGVMADSYSPAAFQARLGFLASTVLVSWLASVGLLGASSVATLGSFQWAGRSCTEPMQ
jgi:hypothetical protein